MHTPTHGPSNLRSGMLMAALAAVLFSAKAIFVKLAYRYGVDAVTLLGLRMAFALPFFAFIAVLELRKEDCPAIGGKRMLAIAALGLLGAYIAGVLDFLGLQYISAGSERLILFLYPSLTVLLSRLLFGRRLSVPEFTALICSYVGIVYCLRGDVAFDAENGVLGMLLVFGSALAYAAYLIGSGRMIPDIGARRFMALSTLVACCAVLAQFACTHQMQDLLQPSPVYAYALAIALCSTVLPAFLLADAIRRIGAARASIVGGLGPVATIVLAALFLGERMNASQLLGAALVIGGILILGAMGRSHTFR